MPGLLLPLRQLWIGRCDGIRVGPRDLRGRPRAGRKDIIRAGGDRCLTQEGPSYPGGAFPCQGVVGSRQEAAMPVGGFRPASASLVTRDGVMVPATAGGGGAPVSVSTLSPPARSGWVCFRIRDGCTGGREPVLTSNLRVLIRDARVAGTCLGSLRSVAVLGGAGWVLRGGRAKMFRMPRWRVRMMSPGRRRTEPFEGQRRRPLAPGLCPSAPGRPEGPGPVMIGQEWLKIG